MEMNVKVQITTSQHQDVLGEKLHEEVFPLMFGIYFIGILVDRNLTIRFSMWAAA